MSRQLFLSRGVLAAAGILGAAGVMIGAAGAHRDGGDLARLASLYLLLHAGAAIGLVAVATRSSQAFLLVALLLLAGVSAFAGDLAVVAFSGSHLLSWLAPAGGFVMIAGWLALVVVAVGARIAADRE